MLKFPQELIVHKGLLYVVGGLLMTVTAGSQCVDAAVTAAQNPSNLLRLSNTLIGLVGLKTKANSLAKRKLKRLYFTHSSFNSLLEMTRKMLLGTLDVKVSGLLPASHDNLMSTSANCISAKRCKIYYILISGLSGWPILTLCMGDNRSRLQTYNPSNRLQWLINFSGKAQAQGDMIVLLLDGQTGRMGTGSHPIDATYEHSPTSLTLGFSALSVVFFWMCLPHIAVCALICLVWKVQRHIHRVLQSQIRS